MKSHLKGIIFIIFLFVLLCAGECTAVKINSIGELSPDHLQIVTTTSVDQTGLMGELEKKFIAQYHLSGVDWMVKSSNVAIEEGKNCSVDVVMIPDKDLEDMFIDNGYGLNRRYFGSNYYIIVGPKKDPASIKGKTAVQAFRAIAEYASIHTDVSFISRGDNSGTHAKEKTIWEKAGLAYTDMNNSHLSPWYISAREDIGSVLALAREKQAYALVNAAVYATSPDNTSLARLVDEGDQDLINIYSVMMVNPDKCPSVNAKAAKDWINFLISNETQDFLKEFGNDTYGDAFFFPAKGDEYALNTTKEEIESPVA